MKDNLRQSKNLGMCNKHEEIRSSRKKAARLIEKVLEGHLSVEEARKEWPGCGKPDPGKDKLMGNAYCLLDHWRDDEGIRSKDDTYARWQRQEFKEIIQQLDLVDSCDK